MVYIKPCGANKLEKELLKLKEQYLYYVTSTSRKQPDRNYHYYSGHTLAGLNINRIIPYIEKQQHWFLGKGTLVYHYPPRPFYRFHYLFDLG